MSDSINPYFNARMEWNERYGCYIKERDHWKKIAIGSMVISFLCILGIIYSETQPKFLPYVIQSDAKGVFGTPLLPAVAEFGHQQIIKTEIADFFVRMRSVVSDAKVQQDYLAKVYSRVETGSATKKLLDDHFSTAANPFLRIKKETVSVEVETVLLQAEGAYQVDWRESTFNLGGAQIDEQFYRAVITIELREVETGVLSKNPLGLYVTSINFQRLGQS